MNPPDAALEAWVRIVEAALQSSPERFKLVFDPAGFTEEPAETVLQVGGWRCLNAVTPFDLRYYYEKIYRQATPPETRTLLRLQFGRECMPYDIAHELTPVDLSPAALFPTLQPNLLSGLPIAWYVRLYEHQQSRSTNARLSAQQTVHHILSICLGIELPATPGTANILHLVADLVRRQVQIPVAFVPFLIPENLSTRASSAITDLQRAREFLQSIWQAYAMTLGTTGRIADDGRFAEAMDWIAPLDNDLHVQEEFTQLCHSGELPPIQLAPIHAPLPAWLQQDVHYQVDVVGYLASELKRLSQEIPNTSADLNTWGDFAYQWANWRSRYRHYRQQAQDIQADYDQVHRKLTTHFYAWLEETYSAYIRYPYIPRPFCVHQVLPYLESQYPPTTEKPMVIVVIDGMAWEDWLVLEPLLQSQQAGVRSDTIPILALLPTLTSISRQALLSARLPVEFPEHWQTTNFEKAHWVSFWGNHGLRQDEIGYLRGMGRPGTDGLDTDILAITAQPNLAVAVIIVNGIDDLIHANVLHDFIFQEEVLAWANRVGFAAFIQALRERFHTVVITSDHGHITGKGVGRLPMEHLTVEGSLRVGLFQPPLENHALVQISTCHIWRDHGLPSDLMAVFPEADGFFAPRGEEHISHGGPSLEEVVIPLVIITTEE